MGEKTATARRRGGRLVVLVVVCLLAGFVVQTLVAFGIMKYGVTKIEAGLATVVVLSALVHHEGEVFTVFRTSHRGVFAIDVMRGSWLANESTEPDGRMPSWGVLPQPERKRLLTTMGFGWPWPWLCGTRWAPDPVPTQLPSTQLWQRHPLPPLPTPTWWQQRLGLDRHHMQSCQPIPLNTLANSAFYGVIVAGMWFIGLKARRAWRRRFKPGTCTHCGYALAGLPAAAPCPECGRER